MTHKCPHCEHEIDHLNTVETGIVAYGSCDIDGENCDTNDTCYDNSERTTECPDCGEEVDPDDVIHEDEEEDKEIKPQKPNTPIESTKIIFKAEFTASRDWHENEHYVPCPKCRYSIVVSDEEREHKIIICPSCDKEVKFTGSDIVTS